MLNVKFYIGPALITLDDEADTTKLPVYINEFLPFVDGKLFDIEAMSVTVLNTAIGARQPIPMKAATFITAEYFGMEATQSRPSIAEGEMVLVVSFDDTTDFKWIPLRWNSNLRIREYINYMVANKQDGDLSPVNESNSYGMVVSTHEGRKRLRVYTTRSDNEDFSYELYFAPDSSLAAFRDNVGNSYIIDSANNKLAMQNAVGDFIKIEPGTILANTGMMTIDADLVVKGATKLETTLQVTGATELGSTLDVTGAVETKTTFESPSGTCSMWHNK